jgi:Domain of unknown function (DUF5619)
MMAEQFQKVISVRTKAGELGGAGDDIFSASRAAAIKALEERKIDAVLISWKNNLTGESSPRVESCRCGIEGWELYAVSRGATLRVEVNGGDIIFLFMPVGDEEFAAL